MTQIGISNQTYNRQIDRPVAITIICILGFIGAGLSIPMIFSDIALQIGNWFPPYSAAIAGMSLICMIGLWFIKRWAIYSYIGLVIINQIVLITMSRWNIFISLIQVIIIIFVLISLENYAKSLSHQLIKYIKRQIWALTVAYMLGIHNFYKEEQKTPEDIVITIEDSAEIGDNAPKD